MWDKDYQLTLLHATNNEIPRVRLLVRAPPHFRQPWMFESVVVQHSRRLLPFTYTYYVVAIRTEWTREINGESYTTGTYTQFTTVVNNTFEKTFTLSTVTGQGSKPRNEKHCTLPITLFQYILCGAKQHHLPRKTDTCRGARGTSES